MSMYARLPGISAVVLGFGLSEALAAGDVWKGSWKFELDRQDQPALSYYDTKGRRLFGIACGAHFEMNAVYPGAAPKEEQTPASITIANGKTQMDFAGDIYPHPEVEMPTHLPFFNRRSSVIPSLTKINGARWKIASSIFWTPGSR